MPNLVGIGNSQVPTNAMLGGLAYQDPAHANLTNVEIENIAAIKAKTSDTAVDVFVYDTRKDSDGGAWRKRTSHTTWYNETLGSSTRGSRKEFPAVAVIVAEAAKVTIYDGDDPNCSMWMVFNQGSSDGQNRILNRFMGNLKSVSMLNGNLLIGGLSTSSADRGGGVWINFISEISYAFGSSDAQSENIYGFLFHTISQRNTILGTDVYGDLDSKYQLENNSQCNDVAITVLPNAPIDASTGLPIPTIAVATDGGVSVIKDDGTVVDIRRTNDDDVHHVAFDDDRVIMFMELGAIYVATIHSADESGNPNDAWSVYGTYSANTSGTNYPAIFGYGAGADLVSMKDYTFASAGYNGSTAVIQEDYKGLAILSQNITSSGNGMVAWIKKNFNTGWMHGDIKGAFLSDTDTSNLVDTNLVSNGTFDSNITGWTAASGATLTHDSGRLKITSSSGNSNAYATVTCVVGKKYYFQADFEGMSSFHLSTQGDAGNDVGYIPHVNYGSSTTKFLFFTATQTTMYIVPYTIGTGNVSYIDNVIVKLADHDRSINGKHHGPFSGINGLSSGLQVYGTITRTPVATGAELVSYGGFSATNFLEQPYNSNLNWQNSDFSVYGWFKLNNNGTQQTLMMLMQPDGEVDYLLIEQQSDGDMRFQVDSQSGASVAYATTLPTGLWHHYCGVNIDNDRTYLYINGEPTGLHNGTLHGASDFDNTSAKLTIGRKSTASYNNASSTPFTGQMALWRISNTVPSAEQIKKMYDDEKNLFKENAKCTLYGSSNAVTAVAYDDSNYTLHAGTSSGRSEFRGLNRINNTTTAVTTSISASNKLVAEQ